MGRTDPGGSTGQSPDTYLSCHPHSRPTKTEDRHCTLQSRLTEARAVTKVTRTDPELAAHPRMPEPLSPGSAASTVPAGGASLVPHLGDPICAMGSGL